MSRWIYLDDRETSPRNSPLGGKFMAVTYGIQPGLDDSRVIQSRVE